MKKLILIFILPIILFSCEGDDDGITIANDDFVGDYKTNVLVEDLTGTWCGYCPRPAFKLAELKKTNSQLIVVASHGGRDWEPMLNPKHNDLATAFQINGYPYVQLNRKDKWNEQISKITELTPISSKIGLAIESSLSERTLSVNIKAKFSEDFVGLKYVIYVLENDLIYDQANYADFGYGADNPIVGFKHDHVLRKTLTAILGDAVPTEASKKGEYFDTKLLHTYTIPDDYNKDKMEIVAFIIKDNKVINARHSEFGATQSLEKIAGLND